MKKLMFAIGVFSFLLIGAISVDTVNANTVTDDPPKKEAKSTKSCSDATKTKCCSGKTSAAKCGDKEGKSASTSTTTKNTKKSDPDKK